MIESLCDFVFFFTVVFVASSGGKLTVSHHETVEFVASGHDQTEVWRGWYHRPCQVLGMELYTNEIGVAWREGGREERESVCV